MKKEVLKSVLLAVIIIAAFMPGIIRADWRHLRPTDDAYTDEASPNTNYGSSQNLCVRNRFGNGGHTGWEMNTFVKFDLSVIPPCSKITCAELWIHYRRWRDNNPAGRDLNCYRVTGGWDENTITWSTEPPEAQTPTDIQRVPNTTDNWMCWRVIPDAEYYYENPDDNHGWKIMDENYWGQYNIPLIFFTSKEFPDPDYAPMFDVHWIRCCIVSMVPDANPVIVPAGGSFGLTGIITNQCDVSVNTDIWYGVKAFGNFYQQGRFNNVALSPYQQMSGHLNQYVPRYAPAGSYEYIAYSGDYSTGEVCDSFSFTFTVIAPVMADGPDEWTAKGSFIDDEVIPEEYDLVSNYPNPFNAQTNISFELITDADVRLEICNLMGQKVETLLDGHAGAGPQVVTWDASGYSSGVYFYKLTVEDKAFIKRMTLLK